MTEKLTDASLKLFHALLSGNGLQHIVDAGAELLGNPLMVYDLSYKILAYSKTVTTDVPQWLDITSRGFGTYDFYKKVKKTEGFKRLADSDRPVLAEYDFVDYKSLTCKINIGGRPIGFASSISTNQEFREIDTALIELFCQTVATELQKNKFLNQTKGMMYEYFMRELLDGQVTDRAAIEERMQYLSLNLDKNIYILTICYRPLAAKNNDLPYLRDILADRIPVKGVLFNNSIIMLLSHKKPNPLSEYHLTILTEFLRDNDMVAGLSRRFLSLADTPSFYQQSLAAINLGLRLEKDKAIFNYEDYALYHLLDVAAGQKDLKEFCNPLLFQLMDYDCKNNTNFTQSLFIFLINGSDLSKAAQFFGIHRNSMDYRIKKIEEILSIDLRDANVALSLHISFKILTFLEGQEFIPG